MFLQKTIRKVGNYATHSLLTIFKYQKFENSKFASLQNLIMMCVLLGPTSITEVYAE